VHNRTTRGGDVSVFRKGSEIYLDVEIPRQLSGKYIVNENI
jgi:hypothetical protein